MTKSFDSSSPLNVSQEIKDKLVQLMDDEGLSLIRASQILKIPYTVAKQILFTNK